MMPLEDFLWPTQEELFQELRRTYKEHAVCRKGKYLLIQGEAPILLLAHLDTVHKEPVQVIRKKQGGNILTSSQGIFLWMGILPHMGRIPEPSGQAAQESPQEIQGGL